MKVKLRTLKTVFACVVMSYNLQAFAEVVVITNKAMPVSNLSQEEVYRIYLGKSKFLSNGSKVIPVDQRVGSPARNKFYSDVIKKSDTEMKSYWARVIFTGQGNPPIQESDDNAVKELVSKNPNCIGYIDRSAVDNSVKVVFTAP